MEAREDASSMPAVSTRSKGTEGRRSLAAPDALAVPVRDEVGGLREVGGFPCAFAGRLGFAERDMTRVNARAYHLILQLSGEARWSQGDCDVVLHAGDSTLIDGRTPARAAPTPGSTCLCLHIPRELLDERLRGVRTATLPGPGAGALLGSLIRSAFDNAHALTPDQHGALREALLALVGASWGRDGEPAPDASAPEPALISRIKASVAERLDDPELSPGSIARAHGVSVRHLHRLFGLTGSSLGEWVRRNRLERCAADLRDPRLAHESLTQIAFRWGFNDSAHFSRSFRAAYDETPRAYRTRRLECERARGSQRPAAADHREMQTCL